jgi:pyruvate,water dikinase
MTKTIPKEEKFVLWFDELGREEVPLVGGKSASLGEMTSKTKVPVPFGFATTAAAYTFFIEKAGLEEKIAEVLQELTDPEDTRTLEKVGAKLRQIIMDAPMPKELDDEIAAAYNELTSRYQKEAKSNELPYVAVRSSATAEDLPDASFAGQQETYLNVLGAEEVVDRVKECYSSLFTDRAIYYRVQKGFDHMDIALSACVQLMVFSESAGVMFTLNVSTGDRKVILIEAGWGLGEYVVQGTITPDEYIVTKSDLTIASKSVNKKAEQLIRTPGGGVEHAEVPDDKKDAQILTDDQIVELAKYAVDIEKHYPEGSPCGGRGDRVHNGEEQDLPRVARQPRSRGRQGPRHRVGGGNTRVRGRRDTGNRDDRPGLGSRHEEGQGHRDQFGWDDLPRCHREPGIGDSVHSCDGQQGGQGNRGHRRWGLGDG